MLQSMAGHKTSFRIHMIRIQWTSDFKEAERMIKT